MFEEMLVSVRQISSKLIMMIEFKRDDENTKKSSSDKIKERLRKKTS